MHGTTRRGLPGNLTLGLAAFLWEGAPIYVSLRKCKPLINHQWLPRKTEDLIAGQDVLFVHFQ
jgi:hypothetical protein